MFSRLVEWRTDFLLCAGRAHNLVKPGNGAGGVVREEQQQAKGVEQKREEEAHREG